MAAACGSAPTAPTAVSQPPAPPLVATPTITCPVVPGTATVSSAGAAISFATPVVDGGQAPVTVACSPTSGSLFPIGTTAVSCVATDQLNRTASCGFAVVVTRIPQLSRTRFLAFGDSTTAGEVVAPVAGPTHQADVPSHRLVVVPAAAYPTVLQARLAERYLAQTPMVVNAGRSGEGAADSATLPRFIEAVNTHRPDVVLILTGYNDLLGLGPLGVNATGAIAAVNALAAEARGRSARVFIGTVTPNRPGLRRSIPTSVLQSFNERLVGVARGEGAVLVDLYAALAADVNTYIGADGLHPTEEGYRRMAEVFFAAIRDDLELP